MIDRCTENDSVKQFHCPKSGTNFEHIGTKDVVDENNLKKERKNKLLVRYNPKHYNEHREKSNESNC